MARGSVTKRKTVAGDSWRIAVELPPDPETGKRQQRWETFHGSKKDADKRLTELQALVDHQQLGATSRTTLAEYLERWLTDYADTKSPKTQDRYQQVIDSYVIPHLGKVRLDRLAPMHFVGLQSKLRETDRKDGKGKLSAQTILHVHRVLHVALRCAVEWRLMAANPMDGVKAPRPERQQMRCFDVAEARRFLDGCAAEGAKWHALFAALLLTGARPGELKALRWEDVDLAAGVLHIQRHVQRINGRGFVLGDTKTAGSRRSLAIGGDLMALLRKHRAEQNVARLRLGPEWQDNGLIFPSETGNYLDQEQVRDVFARVCARAQLPRIRVYDLRHTSATLLLSTGVDLKTVSERLGHASPNLVLSTYGHTLPGAQTRASEALEGLLRAVQ
ncbi:MAG: site-specific integrase [Anaerolineae bacterium]